MKLTHNYKNYWITYQFWINDIKCIKMNTVGWDFSPSKS